MKRAAIEKARTVRIWRAHLAGHREQELCVCEFQAGRFRKGQRIGGCGRPRCRLCHGDKLDGAKSFRDRRSLLVFDEGMRELPVRITDACSDASIRSTARVALVDTAP